MTRAAFATAWFVAGLPAGSSAAARRRGPLYER